MKPTVRIRNGKSIRYKIQNDVLLFDTDSKQISAFMLRPDKIEDVVTKIGMIIAVYIDDTTIQFTFEPYTDMPKKIRTRNAEIDIKIIPHNFVTMSLLMAGQNLAQEIF